jgi:hypothetical protein
MIARSSLASNCLATHLSNGCAKARAYVSTGTDASENHRKDRYHLFLAWGFGFWSVVNYVVIWAMLRGIDDPSLRKA